MPLMINIFAQKSFLNKRLLPPLLVLAPLGAEARRQGQCARVGRVRRRHGQASVFTVTSRWVFARLNAERKAVTLLAVVVVVLGVV